MARLESQAIAGYYPTPERLVPLIAGLFVRREDKDWSPHIKIGDPCAGDGAAVYDFAHAVTKRSSIYSCELEGERYKSLRSRGSADALHGDAFHVHFAEPFLSVLYLNPPYDLDPVYGRLEQRFLDRFHAALVEDGWLVFLVPHYALGASAELLATAFDDVDCYRFPSPEVEAYKQVVLVARRCDDRPLPDRDILARVESWATPEGFAAMPELAAGPTERRLVEGKYVTQGCWVMRRLDLVSLVEKVRPWQSSSKVGRLEPVSHVLPELSLSEMIYRRFPVAVVPRPSHIAAGIAAGLFNGREVRARNGRLPPLLVKGVFEREYVTAEEKRGVTGEVTSVVQVQVPKLVVVVLDLSSGKYIELRPGGGRTGAKRVEDMTLEDVLEAYGPDLLRVMREQCPVSYDAERDRDSIELASLSRDLYPAQADAGRAVLQLLGGSGISTERRRRLAALLLGEIGVGKTSVALSVAKSVARRTLVLCPPHLLDSWRKEARAVVPEATVRVLEGIDDVDELAELDDPLVIAVLSRETAKLGHGYGSVRRACPRCGARVPKDDHGKKRSRCEAEPLVMRGPLARLALALALRIGPSDPENAHVRAILSTRHGRRMLRRWAWRKERRAWPGFDPRWAAELHAELFARGFAGDDEHGQRLLGEVLLACYDESQIEQTVRDLECGEKDGGKYWYGELALAVALLLPDGERRAALREEFFKPRTGYGYGYYGSNYDSFASQLARATDEEDGQPTRIGKVRIAEGRVMLDGCEPGSLDLARRLLAKLTKIADIKLGRTCGEPLYQAIPEPRRYPLARYIVRRYPKLFDLLVLDEGHEYSTSGDSAQSHAAQRLMTLGIPLINATGSVMNGYARSLFTTFQMVSPSFREEFERGDLQRFIDRYGYRKRVLQDYDRDEARVVEFGTVSDRVVRRERDAGDAPGVLPLFLFRHLLAHAVTLHKADLRLSLPACRQVNVPVAPTGELGDSYRQLLEKLKNQIRRDQFQENLSGKLFGQLSELPSYLDRATLDVGNSEDGAFVVRYPESVGGSEVARGYAFSASHVLPKEQAMLETLERELDEGRNVMVFTWHVNLLPRIKRLIEKKFRLEVPVLDNVPTHKRIEWIERVVVEPNRRVLLTNPTKVQTGLNNLVHFSSQWWHENPACNPIGFRQPVGRVDRIGQRLETRIYVPYYEGTLQQAMHDLLMRKVAISIATDGLDPESVLIAAGGTEDAALAGLSLGRQLWAILNEHESAAAE